jgi:hypothetical protein
MRSSDSNLETFPAADGIYVARAPPSRRARRSVVVVVGYRIALLMLGIADVKPLLTECPHASRENLLCNDIQNSVTDDYELIEYNNHVQKQSLSVAMVRQCGIYCGDDVE